MINGEYHPAQHAAGAGDPKAVEWLQKRTQLEAAVHRASDAVFALSPGDLLQHIELEHADNPLVKALIAARDELEKFHATW